MPVVIPTLSIPLCDHARPEEGPTISLEQWVQVSQGVGRQQRLAARNLIPHTTTAKPSSISRRLALALQAEQELSQWTGGKKSVGSWFLD